MTEAQLLESIQSAFQKQEGGRGLTTLELSQSLKLPIRVIRALIRQGLADGVLVHTTKLRKTIVGTLTPTPAFTLAGTKRRSCPKGG